MGDLALTYHQAEASNVNKSLNIDLMTARQLKRAPDLPQLQVSGCVQKERVKFCQNFVYTPISYQCPV